MMLAGALFGGTCFALYPLCVAHTNDHLRSTQRVGASSGLILIYSLGAAAGPLAAAGTMEGLGPRGLFLFIAGCASIVLIFAGFRIWSAPPVPRSEEHTSELQSLMSISYAGFCLRKKNQDRSNETQHYTHKEF